MSSLSPFIENCNKKDNVSINNFEKNWVNWDINDTILWFRLILATKSVENMPELETYDFDNVATKMQQIGFSARKDLPMIAQQSQWEQFCINDTKIQKLLFDETKRLITMYQPSVKE